MLKDAVILNDGIGRILADVRYIKIKTFDTVYLYNEESSGVGKILKIDNNYYIFSELLTGKFNLTVPKQSSGSIIRKLCGLLSNKPNGTTLRA